MDFKKDLRDQIIKLLKEENIIFNEQNSIGELLISYLNILNRRIIPMPRKVFVSDNVEKIIKNNKLDKKYMNALLKFKREFESGMDMNGHLSANIYHSDIFIEDTKQTTYKQSRDYLLDDWGIYHLHLNEKEAKNKNEMHRNRAAYLLFVKVTNTGIYFVDILEHNDKNVFAKQELLETLDRNWHFLLKDFMVPGLTCVNSKLSDNEINKARQAGSLLLYEVNGNIFTCIGGWLTSAGTNIIHTNYSDKVLDEVQIIEEDIKNRYSEIQSIVGNYDKDLEFKFELTTNGYLVTEINSTLKVCYHIEEDNLAVYYDGFTVKY